MKATYPGEEKGHVTCDPRHHVLEIAEGKKPPPYGLSWKVKSIVKKEEKKGEKITLCLYPMPMRGGEGGGSPCTALVLVEERMHRRQG